MEGSAVQVAEADVEEPLFSPLQAAEYIRRRTGIPCSDDTVRRMCDENAFPKANRGHRRTSQWWIPQSDLDAYVKAKKLEREKRVVRRVRAA